MTFRTTIKNGKTLKGEIELDTGKKLKLSKKEVLEFEQWIKSRVEINI